tara:strand:- start:185 stop:493 length:309 start_codon:yes stop_codon:yes gene_type:complete
MSEPTDKEVKAAEEVLVSRYDAMLDSPLLKEYEGTKAEYKASMRNCVTIADRKKLMTVYQEDLIDIAVDARIDTDWILYTQINSEINSLEKRLARRGGNTKY